MKRQKSISSSTLHNQDGEPLNRNLKPITRKRSVRNETLRPTTLNKKRVSTSFIESLVQYS